MYQQWLRVYMRTQMIKHNKDLLESVDDTLGLLAKLHIFQVGRISAAVDGASRGRG